MTWGGDILIMLSNKDREFATITVSQSWNVEDFSEFLVYCLVDDSGDPFYSEPEIFWANFVKDFACCALSQHKDGLFQDWRFSL